MTPLPRGVRRLLRLDATSADVERDVDEEIAFHFDRLVADLRAQGMDEASAAEAARRRFGDVHTYRERLRRIDDGRVKMRERSDVVDTVTRTLAHAFRSARRAPGFTAAVGVILALGIGANAVMFGVVDRLLLSPPEGVADWEQVRLLYFERSGGDGARRADRTVTYPDYRDLVEAGAFAEVGAYSYAGPTTMGRGDAAERVRVQKASATLFSLLGAQPVLGRFYSEEEDRPGATPTAVLAHDFWERRFAASPDVLGRTLEIGGGTYTVVGVAPEGFTGAELDPIDTWLALEPSEEIDTDGTEWKDGQNSRNWYWLRVVARLAPAVTAEAAAAEATALHRAGREEHIAQGRYDADVQVIAAPIIAARGPTPSNEASVALWLAGVSAIVLLIACLNVANLLMARATRRRRELAVRVALGVSRRRLLSELLAESLVLAAVGALAALAVAFWGSGWLHQALLPDVHFGDRALGPRLLLFTGATTLLTALLSGVIPALQASRPDAAGELRSGGRGHGRPGTRARAVLLVGQAALSVALLVGAGFFVLSLHRAQTLDLGFDPGRVVVSSLEWNESLPDAERLRVFDEALERVRRLPGVEAAGLSYTIPFWSSMSVGNVRVPGLDSVPRHARGGPYVNKVGSGYFEAMGLTIVRGRPLLPTDDAEGSAPVAVLTEGLARAAFPAGDELGGCLLVGRGDDVPCTEVVGVVEDHRREELVEAVPHFLYFVNLGHTGVRGTPQALMVRTAEEARDLATTVRDEVRAVSPLIRFAQTYPLQNLVDPQLRSWKLGASMFTLFGLLALLVAAWGLYSVLAFDIALRHRELGIRAALGASVGRLVKLVFRQAVLLVSIGVALGLVASVSTSRFVEPLLFRVSVREPDVYLAVAAILLAVAAAAGSLPAWRATRVDPREALQNE